MDFRSGKIVFNDFDLNSAVPLNEQIWSLKEDILQVEYSNEYILDVGWVHDFDAEKGCFKLVIIKQEDWLNPIFVWKTKSVRQLYNYMNEAVSKLELLVK
ncbi:hypothetical protein [Paenibacillus nuruki]|uniref:hypothetical protein n=1 Tax=Paenibacillus nuruki TaxID=1886670 RepID=UPI0028051DAB|nr:hypothetical protein [Paenibacillus nuruki]